MFEKNRNIFKEKRAVFLNSVRSISALATAGVALAMVFGVSGCSNNSSSGDIDNSTSAHTDSSSSAHTHVPGTPVHENEVAATCTEGGSYDLVTYCTSCKEKISSEHMTTDPLGHDLIHHAAKTPTCVAVGWDAYDTCSRCDYSTYVEIPINSTAHNYDDTVVANVSYAWINHFTAVNKTVLCKNNTAHDTQVTDASTKLHITSNLSNNGGFTINEGYGLTAGEHIDITVSTPTGYVFAGWYSDSGYTSYINSETSFSFDMPDPISDYYLYAKFNEIPGYTAKKIDDNHIAYGMYPTETVSSALKTALNNARDSGEITKYKDADGNDTDYYLYRGDFYVFKDPNWYRGEALSWRILNTTGNNYFVVSEQIIDAHRFDDSSSEWESSESKAFLEETVAARAFSLCKISHTSDSLSFLTKEDCENTDYFENKSARKAGATRWAINSGTTTSGGYGYYWTKTPTSDPASVYAVNTDGNVSTYSVTASVALRPCVSITIK